ncbi:NepR family anti-sigma factor [Camelimonas abortus]|uniref:NepR family anti-sigma factor n=1 Tax=Camelimonas abortus TaxID=1017184 RepID=A0ABV7LBL6_9HYPH
MNQFKFSDSHDAREGRDGGADGAGREDVRVSADARGTGQEDPVERAIAARLRAVYDEVVSLPVPDRFLDLLSSLDGKTACAGGGADGEDDT